MIITDVRAENFLKYAELDLSDLPESGLIAVSGPNESGKSTIGETICFALFGRTYAVEADTPAKLIRWGQPRCAVSIDFKTKDGQAYRASRYLDSEGTQGARLERLGVGETTVAKGADQVAAALPTVTGFDYEEFVESFYLAQRELTAPHPHSHALMAMAGIAPLAKIVEELRQTNAQDAAANAETENQIADVDAQITELAIDPQRLPSLESTRERVASVQANRSERLELLQRTAADYQEKLPAARAARRGRGWGRLFGLLFLVLAAILWAGWALLTYQPSSDLAQRLSAWLTGNVPWWQTDHVSSLLPAAVAATVLLIVAWFLATRQGGNLARLTEHAEDLDRQLELAYQDASTGVRDEIQAVAQLVAAPVAVATAAESAEPSETTGAGQPERLPPPATVAALRERVIRWNAEAAEVKHAIDGIGPTLLRQSMALKEQLALMDRSIGEEQQRVREAERLRSILESHRSTHREKQHRIRVRDLGMSLLVSASRERSHQFNGEVRSLAGRALPLFTKDQYQHLQIDEDLTVRIFSNEKHDFMDFDEISSGTQRQIMLAVRLGLSQELIRATVGGAQFVFLDEPFAFFDEQRMLATLHALPELSDELAQIWIIAQQLPEAAQVNLHIECTRGAENLRVAAPQAS